MTDLENVSGLPMALGDDCKLVFKKPIEKIEPTARTLKEMRPVLLDPNADPGRQDLYYMYRNVHFPDHDDLIKKMGLTYDVTVIPPGLVGQEYNKTEGHYHANAEGSYIAYPEIYEVLHGKALFILQKMDPEFKKLIRVFKVEASAGQKVIYPPNYGHIIVNTGSEPLVTANWVADHFERMYQQVIDYHGLAYYAVDDGNGGVKFIPNPHYTDHPPIKELTNQYMMLFNIMRAGPMYWSGTNSPVSLEFLNNPQKYAVELSSITS